MASESELRSYSDTWIRLSAGVLVLQLAILTYVLSNYERNTEHAMVIFYLGVGMAVTSLSSVAVFLAARDPRQIKFSISRLINLGVGLVSASLIISAAGIAYHVYIMTENITNAWIIFVGLFFSLLIFYPFLYFKYISNQKPNAD